MILLVGLIGLMAFCVIVLSVDARRGRMKRQVETALALRMVQTPLGETRPVRPPHKAMGILLRVLFGYVRTAPRFWKPKRAFTMGAMVAAAAGVLTALVFPLWLAIGVACLVDCGCTHMLFGSQTRSYCTRLLRQLPDVIEMVVSMVRAGLPIADAFRHIAQDMDGPAGEQFRLVVDDIAFGRTVDEAVRAINTRTGIDEYAMFAVTLVVQSKTGGRLAETLQTLGDTVRQRIALAGRANALAGEAKLSARVLSGIPFVAGGFIYLLRPEAIKPFFTDSRGQVLLAFGIVSLGIGIFTMRRMIRKGTTV
jgi:tight adherence protein B